MVKKIKSKNSRDSIPRKFNYLYEKMSYDFMKYAVLRGEENIKKTVEFAGNILPLYKCHQCGNCCRTIPVELDEDEVIKLVKIEGESFWEKLDEKKTHNYLKTPCPYLKENKCSIYKDRPLVCRTFPFTLSHLALRDLVLVVLCPLGREIDDDICNFIKNHEIETEDSDEKIKEMYETGINFCADVPPTKERMPVVAISLSVIEEFLKEKQEKLRE